MDRRCARALLFTAILSAAVLAAVYLVQSQAGLRGRAHGADWASHLGMIDLILRGEDVRAHGAQIGTGVVSPLFAHGLAAALSSVTGLSTIRVIAIIASLAAIVSVVVAGLRSVWVVLVVAQNRLARLAGWIVAAAAFFVLSALGIGFYGQIDQANYFFSQAVGTAAALLALSAIQLGMAREGRSASPAIVGVPILAFILAWIHLIPALWFAAAGAICALSLARPLRQRLALFGALAALSLLLVLIVPASREVLQLPQAAQGVLNLRLPTGLFQLDTHPGLLIIGLAALAMLIAAVALIEKPSHLPFRLFNLHAGAIAILLLGVLTLLALTARGGTGYYGLAKYAFLFTAEATLLMGHIVATALNRFGTAPAKPVFAVLALLLAIFAQQRAAPPDRRDQTLLIDMQQALSKIASSLPQPTPFPLDERLSGAERLYLFTSPMGQAKDGRAQGLLGRALEDSLSAARENLPASLIPDVVPPWNGVRIELGEMPAPSPLVFFGQWGSVGDEGRRAYPAAAHVSFNIASQTGELQLCLRVRASTAEATTFESTFAINGTEIRTDTFRDGDRPREVGLPLSGRRGDVVLTILNRAETTPAARANGSLLLESIWLAPNCGRVRVSFAEDF
jgi:hypothetical protein